MSDQSQTCDYCDRTGLDLNRCGKCHVTYYCDRRCQKLAWSKHKLTCFKSEERQMDNKQDTSKKNRETESRKSVDNITNKADLNDATDSSQHNSMNEDQDAQSSITGSKDAHIGTTGSKDVHSSATGSVHDEERSIGNCGKCGHDGCSLRCARCKNIFYCSKQCQKKDWKKHKTQCLPEKKTTYAGLTTDERHTIDNIKTRQARFRQSAEQCRNLGMNMQDPFAQRMLRQLSPGQLEIHDRPLGSLAGVLRFANRRFPGWKIIDRFDDIPPEFLPFPMALFVHRTNYVVVAFMFMYHEHTMRHGVYLKDSRDEITNVQFYIDYDIPWPYFSYSQIKPGSYILLENPVIHRFMDGQVGIRIDDPSTVKTYNPNNSLHI